VQSSINASSHTWKQDVKAVKRIFLEPSHSVRPRSKCNFRSARLASPHHVVRQLPPQRSEDQHRPPLRLTRLLSTSRPKRVFETSPTLSSSAFLRLWMMHCFHRLSLRQKHQHLRHLFPHQRSSVNLCQANPLENHPRLRLSTDRPRLLNLNGHL